MPRVNEDTDERDDWRRLSDGCGLGPRGRHASTEALIASTSAPSRVATVSFGLMLIFIRLIGSKSSESESELELLIMYDDCNSLCGGDTLTQGSAGCQLIREWLLG